MRSFLLAAVLLCSFPLSAQFVSPQDPGGYPDPSMVQVEKVAAAGWGWGYNYDSLRADLAKWKLSPYVAVDSVGVTVQGRTMYVMTIHNTATPATAKKRIWIHARTHPIEVQGERVTNEIIRILLSETAFAATVRDSCVFSIMPMYNADGVELGIPYPNLKFDRQNANNIDIESNWNAATPQPEVQVLRAQFVKLMAQPNPIRVALNMHSAYGKIRYFVYHLPGGTSAAFAQAEQQFIGGVQKYFPGGIQDYDKGLTSWATAPALQYPESWFWQNTHEAVMALTYEDINDTTALNNPWGQKFEVTANAILHGISDYLGVTRQTTSVRPFVAAATTTTLEPNYPNPFNPSTTLRFSIVHARPVELTIVDVLGRTVATLVHEAMQPGTYAVQWNAADHPSGIYFAVLHAGPSADGAENIFLSTRKLLFQK